MHINYFTKELEILNKRIFFSREHNIMFLTTPKCGSQFIKMFCLLNFTKYATVSYKNTEHNFREWFVQQKLELEDLNNPDIQKYQIIRNPYERLVSFFKSNSTKVLLAKDTFSDFINLLNNPTNTFKSYLENSVSYLQFYEHLFPQYHWLFSKYFTPIKLEKLDDKLKDIYPSFILPNKTNFSHHSEFLANISFENFVSERTVSNEQYLSIVNNVSIKEQFNKHKEQKNKHWQSLCTPKIRNQIYDLYRDDFVKFNYER